MKVLRERIISEANIKEGNLIKVDGFLNHQVDVKLMNQFGKEFAERFKDINVDKIVTAEVSGIAIAAIVAQYFDVPMVFARKTESQNLSDDIYATDVYSYTGEKTYKIMISKKFLNEDEDILIIDDFLANGQAVSGLIELVELSNANIVGVGVVIEKGFQPGGKKLREDGIRLESLAIVDKIDGEDIKFRD